jgi:hypothetical protein
MFLDINRLKGFLVIASQEQGFLFFRARPPEVYQRCGQADGGGPDANVINTHLNPLGFLLACSEPILQADCAYVRET